MVAEETLSHLEFPLIHDLENTLSQVCKGKCVSVGWGSSLYEDDILFHLFVCEVTEIKEGKKRKHFV